MKASEVRELMKKREEQLAGQDKALYDEIMAEIVKTVQTAEDKVEFIKWSGKMTEYVRKNLLRDKFSIERKPSFKAEDSYYIISWAIQFDYCPNEK